MAQVFSLFFIFFCYFSDIESRSWITSSFFSLALFRAGDPGLRLISKKRKVVGLSLFFVSIGSLIMLLLIDVVFVFLDRGPVCFWAPKIDFSSSGGWLEACFCFCIDSLLYHLVPHIQVLPSVIQLSSNRWT